MDFNVSTFAQFVGAGTPVGGFTFASFIASNGLFTSQGQEYLQTGYTVSYTSKYANLISAQRSYGISDPTTNPITTGVTSWFWARGNGQGGPVAPKWYAIGSNYFRVFHGSNPGVSTQPFYQFATGVGVAPTNGPNAPSSSNVYDSAFINNRIVQTYATSTPSAFIQSFVNESVTIGQSCAYNSPYYLVNSPSLVVAIRNTAQNAGSGAIYTSTDGTSWTARTGSTNMGTVSLLAYSKPGSTFICVNTSGNIFTSTDGFTWTSRTTPSAMLVGTNFYPARSFNATFQSASSDSVCIINLGGTDPFMPLLKTTDGTSFSISNLSADSPNAVAQLLRPEYFGAPGMVYDGTRFLIYPVNTYYDEDNASAWYIQQDRQAPISSADGVTWRVETTKAPVTFARAGTSSTQRRYPYGTFISISYVETGSKWFVEQQGWAIQSSGTKVTMYPFDYTDRMITNTPQFVGTTGPYGVVANAGTSNGLRYLSVYLRIA